METQPDRSVSLEQAEDCQEFPQKIRWFLGLLHNYHVEISRQHHAGDSYLSLELDPVF